MARHVYFDAGDGKVPSRRGVHFVTLWVALLVIFLSVWGLVQLEPRIAPVAYGGLVLVLALVVVLGIRRNANAPFTRMLQAAELSRLRENIADAVERARALVRMPLTAHQRAQVLLLLGACAEHEGDFAEAAEVLVRAEGTLRAGTMHPMVRAQYVAIIAARRAFAHAASGDLDRARATLAATRSPDAFPTAASFARRAELVISAREGAFERLASELRASETLFRNTLSWRDRALVHVLERVASRDQGEATHGALTFDPVLATWVTRVLGPNAAPYVRAEGAA